MVFEQLTKTWSEIASYLGKPENEEELDRLIALSDYLMDHLTEDKNLEGLFILTGSQQFEMMSRITQSLAGRTAIVKLLPFTRKIAKAVQRGLNPNRVCLVFEGLEINHIHPKLYPIFADSYPGFLSTEKGINNAETRASDDILKNFAEKIKKALL